MALTDGDSGGVRAPSRYLSLLKNNFRPAPAPRASPSPVPSSGTPWAPQKPARIPQQFSYAPVQRAYVPPPAPVPQPYNGPASWTPNGGVQMGTFNQNTGNAGGGMASAAMAAPVEPPKPKIDYNSKEYLSGAKDSELDSTFHDQKTMYSEKLKKYIADYDAQTGGKAWGKNLKDFNLDELGGSMGVDYDNAKAGISRNKTQGLTGVAEDFAQRGMINSGLYAKDWQESNNQYERQGQNLGQGVRNQLQTLNFNRGNQQTDNTAQIAAARRDALNRLSQSQSLL